MVAAASPPHFPLWESGDQVISHWERGKAQGNRWNQDMVAEACRILRCFTRDLWLGSETLSSNNMPAVYICASSVSICTHTDQNRRKMMCSDADAWYTCIILLLWIELIPKNDCSTAGQEPQMSSESYYSLMKGKEEVQPPESAALRWVN